MTLPHPIGLMHAKARRYLDTAEVLRRQTSEYQFLQTATEADVVDLQRKAAEFLDRTEAFLKREEEKTS